MFIPGIFRYNSNVLLAGIISLLLVILFVLLLHIYAKWFLVHTRRRRRNSVPELRTPRPRHANRYTLDTSVFDSPCKGLDPSVIASIPLFVYEPGESDSDLGLDCVICLSVFEEREAGRRLPKCKHEFHVECIDMWLKCHSNCPICRSLVEGCLVNSDKEPEIEVVVEAVSYGENETRVGEVGDSMSLSSFSSSSSSSLSSQVVAFGDSFKRMLSRNRSEHKVHPSGSAAQFTNEERERELVIYTNTYS